MRGLTDYITQAAWSDILTVQYILIDDCYQQLDVNILPKRKFTPFGEPDFSDSEVITIALFGEMVFSGAEDKTLHFIRQYHLDMFPNLLDNSRFNRRRHQLVEIMEAIREHLRDHWRAKLFWFSVKWTQALKNKSLLTTPCLLPKQLSLLTSLCQFLMPLVKNLQFTMIQLIRRRDIPNG